MMVSGRTIDGSSLLSAAEWLEGLVQGPLAVTLAVLAVAATGLMMLNGRLPVRRGLVVTLGCFLMFGAPAIAKGLFASAVAVAGPSEPASQMPNPSQMPHAAPHPVQAEITDPYAGASVAR